MKKGERIIAVEGFYILGLLELVLGTINERISKKDFKMNYHIITSSIKEYIYVLRGWK